MSTNIFSSSHCNMEEEVGEQEEAVRVFVRIRPLNKREIAEKQTIGWNFNDTAMLEDTPNGQRVYAYDHCFGPTASNQETYDIVGKPVVLKAMEGYNGTVFTYGQTGSGKTWTMRGSESDPGMMVLCVRDILEWVKSHPEHKYTLKVAYLEVYNEEINDLLGEQGPCSKNLKIVSEDAAKGAVIGNLVEEVAKTAEDFMAILQRGEASRSYASTNMNAESSRSHTIYRVSIETREPNAVNDDSPPLRTSYLNLVDLAGSERQKSTKAEGKILKEGANINKSLLALGAVINKLGEASKKQVKGAKPAFIPYRDSKLTRILKQSLGGNTMTSILCAVTPAPMHREETVSTLKFGQTCKSIKNSVKTNDGVLDDKTLIKQYRQTIQDMKAQIEELQAGEAGGGSKLDAEARAQYEGRIQALEALLVSQGMSTNEISAIVQNSAPALSHSLAGSAASSLSHTGGLSLSHTGESEQEIARLNERLAEQQRTIAKLERRLDEYGDLEESKANFEEYEHNVRQELDEETQKVEDDKSLLQSERFKLLKDRSAIDEKESRIGLLITNLDEKESKLRQLMASMKDQQELWQRSVNDLQRREDLVHDWQRNHKQREKKLEEIETLQNNKFAELKERESRVLEEENKIKQSQKELVEREQRLQVGLSRIANGELANNQKEEALQQFETSLKKKEHECDLRDRELSSRRKELESWDVLLREKDRKIANEQKQLDERESQLRAQEEKVKAREVENERKALELKAKEAELLELERSCRELQQENQAKARALGEKEHEQEAKDRQQREKDEELRRKEKQLQLLQEQCREIQAREGQLQRNEEAFKAKENEFYNVKVAEITSRHNQELRGLNDLVKKQLKIAADFQRDLESTRADVAAKTSLVESLEELLESKNQSIEQLREQVQKLESGHLASISAAVNGISLGEMGEVMDSSSGPHSAEDDREGCGSTVNRQPFTPSPLPHASQTGTAAMSRSFATPAPGSIARVFNANASLSSGEVLTQLALTRHLIYQVLEKHDALPDTKAAVRRGYTPRPSVSAKTQTHTQSAGTDNNSNNNNGGDNASTSSSAPSVTARERERERERERDKERRHGMYITRGSILSPSHASSSPFFSEETKTYVTYGDGSAVPPPPPPPPPPPSMANYNNTNSSYPVPGSAGGGYAPSETQYSPSGMNANNANNNNAVRNRSSIYSYYNADSPTPSAPSLSPLSHTQSAVSSPAIENVSLPKQRKNAIKPSSASILETEHSQRAKFASYGNSMGNNNSDHNYNTNGNGNAGFAGQQASSSGRSNLTATRASIYNTQNQAHTPQPQQTQTAQAHPTHTQSTQQAQARATQQLSQRTSSPGGTRSLSKVLSSPPSLALASGSSKLLSPSAADIKSSVVSSVDAQGTPVATVDFGQGSSLRKISRTLQSSARERDRERDRENGALSAFARDGATASPIRPLSSNSHTAMLNKGSSKKK